MSSRDTDQFKERKAKVEQALKSEGLRILDESEGIATIRQLQKATGLDKQAIRRIVMALSEEGLARSVRDKSELVLLLKKKSDKAKSKKTKAK